MASNSEFDLQVSANQREANKQKKNKDDQLNRDVIAVNQGLSVRNYYLDLANRETEAKAKSLEISTRYKDPSHQPTSVVVSAPKPVVNPTIVSGRRPVSLEDLDPVTQRMINSANIVVSGPLTRQGLVNTFVGADQAITAATQTAHSQVQSDAVEFTPQSEASAEVQPEATTAPAPVAAPKPPSSTSDRENKNNSANKQVLTVNDFGETSSEIEKLFALGCRD